jgi:hypothetical protein
MTQKVSHPTLQPPSTMALPFSQPISEDTMKVFKSNVQHQRKHIMQPFFFKFH